MGKYYEKYSSLETCSRKISEVKIRGAKTVGVPMWIINNYIKSTCDNYAKLAYIMNIIDICSDKELSIVDIGISTESVPIDKDGRDFEDKLTGCVKNPEVGKNKEKFRLMSHILKEGEKGFWHYLTSCERPICFAITENDEVILLHDPRGDEGIKVCDISYHSPIDIIWSGIAELIEPLALAGVQVKTDRRLQEEHEAKMVTQAMQTIGEAVNVQGKLQNTNLPDGHKVYLQNMYDAIMEKQKMLNERIGVRVPEIDVRA